MKPIFLLAVAVVIAAVVVIQTGTGPARAAGPCNPAIQPCL